MKAIPTIFLLCTAVYVFSQNTDKLNHEKHPNIQVIHPKGVIMFQDFESGIIPDGGWNLISGPTPSTWDTASYDPLNGNYYAHCLYDESLSGTQDEYLISPVLDMRTYSTAALTFYFQFSQYWGIYPENNYDLYVLASTDSAQTFPDTLWSELNTDTTLWTSFQWVLAQVDLGYYIGQEKFALAFVYHGFDGAEASLDDIAITTTGSFEEMSLTANIYPNPACDRVSVDCEAGTEIGLFDLQGRKVLSAFTDQMSQVELDEVPAGIYLLRVYDEKVFRSGILEIIR